MKKEAFVKLLKEGDIIVTPFMLEQFELYFHLLEKYNKVMDLTNVIEEEAVYERHFFNSLTIAFHENFNHLSLCDVGSGAGFPAIPLKIVFPDMKLTIIDSLSKRMDFLKLVIQELNLQDVTIIPARVEDVAMKYKEKFDIVTARAVARLNILMELCCQLIKVNGTFIAMKGEKAGEELFEAKKAMDTLNLSLIKQTSYFPSTNLFFKKERSIIHKYPRLYAQIKKKPL